MPVTGNESDSGLAETFVEVARTLLSESGEQHTLDRVVQLAVSTIEGCDYAAVSLVRGQRITTPAATDDVPRRVDALQYEVGEGPCLSAIRDQRVYQADDLAAEDRWPNFAHRAAEGTGVRSMLSIRLFAQGDNLGALNMYSRRIAAFGDRDRAVGAVFAAHAAMALVNARVGQQVEQLEYGMAARGDIGQAIGIVMVQSHLTSAQAFGLLTSASQRENVKVREIAARIIQRQEAEATSRA